MAWHIVYLPDVHAVETQFVGTLSAADLADCVISALEEARVRGTRCFLCDATRLVGGHSVFDLFSLADTLHTLGIPAGAREAIVLPFAADRAQDAAFWENACINRGFEVRCFGHRGDALAWLTSHTLHRTGT